MSVTKLRTSVTFSGCPEKMAPTRNKSGNLDAKKSATDLDLPYSEIYHWPMAPVGDFRDCSGGPEKMRKISTVGDRDRWQIFGASEFPGLFRMGVNFFRGPGKK